MGNPRGSQCLHPMYDTLQISSLNFFIANLRILQWDPLVQLDLQDRAGRLEGEWDQAEGSRDLCPHYQDPG